MKTSCFSNASALKAPLSISRWPPRWYAGPQYLDLAPLPELVQRANRGCSYEEYLDTFNKKVLYGKDPRKVYDALVLAFTDEVTLLCYEDLTKPNEWCHRRIVAGWFETNLGVEVPEWTPLPTARSTLSW